MTTCKVQQQAKGEKVQDQFQANSGSHFKSFVITNFLMTNFKIIYEEKFILPSISII